MIALGLAAVALAALAAAGSRGARGGRAGARLGRVRRRRIPALRIPARPDRTGACRDRRGERDRARRLHPHAGAEDRDHAEIRALRAAGGRRAAACASPQHLRLDGELREVTALLTDVEGFSQMTEGSDPRALVRVLDAYFDRVTELIVAHGGMVDKIVGDAVARLLQYSGAACRTMPTRRSDARGRSLLRRRRFAETGSRRRSVSAARVRHRNRHGDRRRRRRPAASRLHGLRRGREQGGALPGRQQDVAIVDLHRARTQWPASAGEIALRPLGRIAARGMQGCAEVFEPWRDDVPAKPAAALRRGRGAERGRPGRRAADVFARWPQDLPDDPVVAMWLEKLTA